MASRRQEKVSRIVKEAVSDAVANHLSDPRIEGFISVTKVEMSPNLKDAEVYISVFATGGSSSNKTFTAIEHARIKIQSIVAARIKSRFCPILHFHRDEKSKKTIETMRIIDEATSQLKERDLIDEE